MEKSISLVDQLNRSLNRATLIFNQLKNEIESEYEEFNNATVEITKLIENQEYKKAAALLEYLDSLIEKNRKNVY